MALTVPIWVVPGGRYSYMNFQMIAAATKLIASGMKMAVLATDS